MYCPVTSISPVQTSSLDLQDLQGDVRSSGATTSQILACLPAGGGVLTRGPEEILAAAQTLTSNGVYHAEARLVSEEEAMWTEEAEVAVLCGHTGHRGEATVA